MIISDSIIVTITMISNQIIMTIMIVMMIYCRYLGGCPKIGAPIAGWFLLWKIPFRWMIWGYVPPF